MASKQLVSLVRSGPEAWNQWRKANLRWARRDLVRRKLGENQLQNAEIGIPLEPVDLSDIDLRGIDLQGANLTSVNLVGAKLRECNLRDACLIWANLEAADLTAAILTNADLRSTDLRRAKLRRIEAQSANLGNAMMLSTHLEGADLTDASLVGSLVVSSWFHGATLKGAVISTVFVDTSLAHVRDLDKCRHPGPSSIDLQTLRSKGIPREFLAGCGLPLSMIEALPEMLNEEYESCFISFAHRDEAFARRLHEDLTKRNIPCWMSLESLKSGEGFAGAIKKAIAEVGKLIVILSESSIRSEWVRREVSFGLDQEQLRGAVAVCPIRIDDAVNSVKKGWAAKLRETRHIGDFSRWEAPVTYERQLRLLLRSLKTTAEPPPAQ